MPPKSKPAVEDAPAAPPTATVWVPEGTAPVTVTSPGYAPVTYDPDSSGALHDVAASHVAPLLASIPGASVTTPEAPAGSED